MIRIGNASGFYGDRLSAVRGQLEGGGFDVLTGDCLAELTVLILGRDRMKDRKLGCARTFLRQMEDCLALDKGVRIVTNAGGLNPEGLAKKLDAKVGHVIGDDLEDRFPEALTANAYLGAWEIADCLGQGTQVVVTGRVTDASLVVGPAAARFGWARDDWDRPARGCHGRRARARVLHPGHRRELLVLHRGRRRGPADSRSRRCMRTGRV